MIETRYEGDAMRRTVVLSAFVLALLGVTTAAAAHPVRYVSKHPIPKKIGHGFCYIDVPHFHDYEPSDPRLYRQMDGQNYFVGDPAPYDYDGPRYSYYGPHPIADAEVNFGTPTYCYLRGPHYHWYQPPPQAQFEMKGGAYWYVGNYDPAYYSDRPRYVAINDAYAPVVYTRPVVDVTVAPPAFRGEIIAGGPGFAAHAVVGAPVVSAGVYVAAPPPPVVQVGVGVGVGGPPVVVGGPVVGGPVYERHDNGRHNGWYKHGRWENDQGEDHDHGRHEGWRGGPPPAHGGGWHGGPGGPPPAAHGNGWRGPAAPAHASAPAGGAWHGGPGTPPQQQKHGPGGWRR